MAPLDPVFITILRWAVGAVFLTAAVHKLSDFSVFKATLSEYRLLPSMFEGTGAAIIVMLELVAGAGLFIPAVAPLVLPIVISLLVLYTLAIAINLARGRRDIDCGCSGPAMRQTLSGWLVVRNGALIAAAALCLLPTAPRQLLWLDGVTIVFGAAVFLLLYSSINLLIANAPRLKALFY